MLLGLNQLGLTVLDTYKESLTLTESPSNILISVLSISTLPAPTSFNWSKARPTELAELPLYTPPKVIDVAVSKLPVSLPITCK